MARRHGGLGRGLDALIPIREEVEKAMQSAGSENVEVFFADDDDSDEPVSVKQTPVIENREQNVSRETQNEIKELKDFEERDSEPVTVLS